MSTPRVARRTVRTTTRSVVGFLALVLTAACAAPSAPDTSITSIEGGGGTLTSFEPKDRKPAGVVAGTLLDGEEFSSTDLAGDVIVYNVWGSWCAPCRKEAPALARAANENMERGVSFVGLNLRDSEDGARAFERKFEMPYASIRSADSPFALLELSEDLRTSSVPTTVLVDREGRIAERIIGEITYATLSGLIDDLVAEAESASPS